jgi:hypothetical protein
MKQNKDIQAVDKLFRKSLEGYSPAPPPSAWKNIRLRLGKGGSFSGQFFAENIGLFFVLTLIVSILGIWAYNSYFYESSDAGSQVQSLSTVQNNHSEAKSLKPNHSHSEMNNDQQKTANNKIRSGNQTDASQTLNPFPYKPETKKVVNNQVTSGILKPESGRTSKNVRKEKPDKNKKAGIVTVSETDSTDPESNNLNTVSSLSVTSVSATIMPVPDKNTDVTDLAEWSTLASEKREKESLNLSDTTVSRPSNNDFTDKRDDKNETVKLPDATNQKSESASSGLTPTPSDARLADNNSQSEASNSFSYYTGLSGSYGQVILKGLNPNSFYSVSLLAGLTHKKSGFGLESGIGYTYYHDRGIFEFEYQRKDTTGYKGYTLFNSYDSSYLVIYKPLVTDTLLYVDTNTRTSYSYLKIPLYFTKQLFRVRKFDIGIKTGPSCDLLMSRNETQPQHSLDGATQVGIKNNSFILISTSWQWLVAPQFSWDITDKIVFRIEPSAVFYLNNLYDKKNRPSAKPYGIGISGGMIFKLN